MVGPENGIVFHSKRRPSVCSLRAPYRSSILTYGFQTLHAFLESGQCDGLLIDPQCGRHVFVSQESLSDGVVLACDLDNDRAGSATGVVERLSSGVL